MATIIEKFPKTPPNTAEQTPQNQDELTSEQFSELFLEECGKHIGEKVAVISTYPDQVDGIIDTVTLAVIRRTQEMKAFMTYGIVPFKDVYPESGEIGFKPVWGTFRTVGDEDFMGSHPVTFVDVGGQIRMKDTDFNVEKSGKETEKHTILFGKEIQSFLQNGDINLQEAGVDLNRAIDHLVASGF